MNQDRGRPQLGLYALVGIGSLNVGTLVTGLVIGWLADGWLGTFPALTITGLGVGIVAGLTASWLRIRAYFAHPEPAGPPRTQPPGEPDDDE